jgi:hypothetical protein
MSTRQRKAELLAQFAAEQHAHALESERKAALLMYDRIEEADINDDLKDILHRFAEHLGLN